MPAGAGRGRRGAGEHIRLLESRQVEQRRCGAPGTGSVASRPQTPAHTHPAMDTVTIKDIPREMLIKDSLKGELLGDRKLRPTEAAEKNVLPSAEDVQTEKKHQSILNGITTFYLNIYASSKVRVYCFFKCSKRCHN